MQTRRDFIKSAAALSGLAALQSEMPECIRAALAIEPASGSTFLDAEHVVILMQENRSFDHAFGTLRGVRGFNDPRAISLPDGNPVWIQANPDGQRFAPFRLDIQNTKSTWMGSLPHSWTDQTDARRGGLYDGWLEAKPSGHKEYAAMPLTLGHYTRQDIPFYYSLADAFTICDQHFCSSLTGTTPNRLYLWTGTIRPQQTPDSPAQVRNEDVDFGRWANWSTFPERLENHGISWKIYQNEISLASGLAGEEEAWLSNFSDNPIEWFEQYNVRYAATHQAFLARRVAAIGAELAELRRAATQQISDAESAVLAKRIADAQTVLASLENERKQFSRENFEKLSPSQKRLHMRAFTTNVGDPAYRQLEEIEYSQGDAARRVKAPKGDVLHQFRQDTASGNLPTVSWLVAPERFSDHPGSAWYGAWYIAEMLNILTRNPEVWKKTIVILTYDENDGYFDHVPPFTPPDPSAADSGKTSAGIDAAMEHHPLEHDLRRKPASEARGGPLGLGYRVPMIIASPWSRGGCVSSQVFDHTSVLQFLETLLSHKTKKQIRETNISSWRRAVCGDLTSVFGPTDTNPNAVPFQPRDAFIQQIHQAQFRPAPAAQTPLSDVDLQKARNDPAGSGLLPRQEPGMRRAAPAPYQLEVNGRSSPEGNQFQITFEARKDVFKERSAGAPFIVQTISKGGVKIRNYAVKAGDRLQDEWNAGDFVESRRQVRVYGPNGFFREFVGSADDPRAQVEVRFRPFAGVADKLTLSLEIQVTSLESRNDLTVLVSDNAYKGAPQRRPIRPGETATLTMPANQSYGWYDLSVSVEGYEHFAQRYAGKIETGEWAYSDPAMA